MERLKTATGRAINCDYFNLFEPAQQLSIQLYGLSVDNAKTIFADKAETAELTFAGLSVSGYTNVVAAFAIGQSVRIVLGKE